MNNTESGGPAPIESQPFDVSINLRIGYRFEGLQTESPTLVMSLRYGPEAYYPGGGVSVPLAEFLRKDAGIDGQRLDRFLNFVMTAFYVSKTAALERYLILHLKDLVMLYQATERMAVRNDVTPAEIIEHLADEHKKWAITNLGELLGRGFGGDFGKPKGSRYWSPIRLAVEILDVAKDLKPQLFTHSTIHRRLRDRHGVAIPNKLDAFKKLLRRLGVHWKGLKATHANNWKPSPENHTASKGDAEGG